MCRIFFGGSIASREAQTSILKEVGVRRAALHFAPGWLMILPGDFAENCSKSSLHHVAL